jgi:eukaryotic-like serine/threonine-protein kinase
MPAKVMLNVINGPVKGQSYMFEEHDTLVFGRMPDCKIRLPESDPMVSRHHFIMEVNPPTAWLRDMGSLNGTYINGVKRGGREFGETPEQGAQRQYPQVELKHGDEVRIGTTIIAVAIETPWTCYSCGKELEPIDFQEGLIQTGSYLCRECNLKRGATIRDVVTRQAVYCLNCGRDVSDEASPHVTGGYLCVKCRDLANNQVVDPMAMLLAMLKEAQMDEDQALNIPDYEVIKKLGQGGMGAVYLVKHKIRGEKAALKIMLPRAEISARAKIKFNREIEVMRGLKHPYIVEFYNHGEVGGIYYILMEFCEGGSVDALAGQHGGKINIDTVLDIMLQALEGLAFAHAQGYVHRDLKPQNILLTGAGNGAVAKIADMGLAKSYQQAGHSGVTGSEFSGTIPFMPREQVSDFKFCKPVSDVWAMGATLYNLLTARYPRRFIKDQDPFAGVLQNPVIPIRDVDPSIPVSISDVIMKALQDEISLRYQDASAFRSALSEAWRPGAWFD